MSLPLRLTAGLLLTIAIEGALALVFVRRWNAVAVTALGNLLTNPALNLVLLLVLRTSPARYTAWLLVLELAAVFTEALILRALAELPLKKAVPLSLLLNAASYGSGLLVFSCIPGGIL